MGHSDGYLAKFHLLPDLQKPKKKHSLTHLSQESGLVQN